MTNQLDPQEVTSSLVPLIEEYKVSSVLSNDRKVYGKKFLFDGKDETCWNSDQGIPQWVHLVFNKPVVITKLSVQFQGGFAGKECVLQAWSGSGEEEELEGIQSGDKSSSKSYKFTPTDTNSVQEITIQTSNRIPSSKEFRLWFNSSTDFYGRIIIYLFDIFGYHSAES